MILVSLDTGNVLLWTRPFETMAGMFANRIAAAFAIDLLLTALVACIWFYAEGKRLGMRRVWVYWVLTLAFGLAGTLPLFLLHREDYLESGEPRLHDGARRLAGSRRVRPSRSDRA